MFNSKSLGVIVTLVVTIPALILGGIGAYNAFNVISTHVKDGSIQESDLKDVLAAKIKLPDGQVLKTQIFFGDVDGAGILGLTTDKGFWRVFVQDDALGVVPPVGGIGSKEIEDNSISADDIGPAFLASVDGVSNDGGNVDFVGGKGVNVNPNDAANIVAFSVDFNDLDPVYVNASGDTMTGDLTINTNLNVGGTATVKDLVVNGTSYHYGVENYYDDVNVEDRIVNEGTDDVCYQSVIGQVCTTGAVFVDDDFNVNGDVLINGNQGVIGTLAVQDYLIVGQDSLLFGDLYVMGDSYHYGEEDYYDDNRFHDDVWLGDGDEDRIVVAGPISSGDGDPLTIEDNSGLIVTRRDDPSVNLFSVDGSGLANFFNDVTVDGNVLPALDSTYDLGASGMEWANLYVDNVTGCLTSPGLGSTYCDDAVIQGDLTVYGTSTHYGVETYYDDIDAQDRILNTAGTLLLDDDVLVSNTLEVVGDSYLDSDVYLGTCACDTIYAFGDFATDLDVDVTDTYDIGRNLVRWQDGFFSGRVLVGIDGAQTILRDNGLRTEGANLLLATTNAGEDIVLRPESDLVRVEGTIRPTDDGLYDLGSNARRWDEIFAYDLDLAGDLIVSGNSYHTGDEYYDGDIIARGDIYDDGGNLSLNDYVDITNDLNLTGDAYLNGDVLLGDAATDVIYANGLFGTGLFNNADGVYDIGTSTSRWGNIYGYDLDLAGDITITGNSYHNGVEEYYDDIDAQDRIVNTIGDVLVDDNLDVSGDLDVTGDAFVTGTATFYDGVNLGDTGTDIIGGFGRFGRDISPSTDASYDLGTASERWDDLYAYNVDLLGTLTANDLAVNNDATIGDASGWGGTSILSVSTTGANGPEACCAPTYEVVIDGDLQVTGAIDPTGILLEPINNGDTAIQVNKTGGGIAFKVNENGKIESSGNIDLVGGLITSNKASGLVTINGQLTVTDLVVSGDAAFNGTATFDTSASPSSNGVYDLGTSLLRWNEVFAQNADLSGDLSVSGTATFGTLMIGATNVSTQLTNLASAVSLLQTADTALDTRIDDLEVGYVTVGGVATGCTTLGSSCSFTVAPAGKTIVSFAASPVGTGNLRLRLDSNPSGATSVTVTVLGGGGDTLSGVSWVATVQ